MKIVKVRDLRRESRAHGGGVSRASAFRDFMMVLMLATIAGGVYLIILDWAERRDAAFQHEARKIGPGRR